MGEFFVSVRLSDRPTHCHHGECYGVIRNLHDRTNAQGIKLLCNEPDDIVFEIDSPDGEIIDVQAA